VTPARAWIAALVLLLGDAGAARAECGLAQCPSRDGASPGVYALAYVQQTSFDLGDPGDYTLGGVRLRWDPGARICLSALTSWVEVRTATDEGRGRRNPVFLGEVLTVRMGDGAVFSGLQWEAPWGDDIVSAPHSEWLGYLRFLGPRGLDVTGGYRFSPSDDVSSGSSFSAAPTIAAPDRIQFHAGHSHSSSSDFASLVNPHEAREVLWRADAAPVRRVVVTVAGQHPLAGATQGQHFVTLGASATIPVLRHVAIVPSASGPISQSRRYDWTIGLELSVH
jgi:hypothetical protein